QVGPSGARSQSLLSGIDGTGAPGTGAGMDAPGGRRKRWAVKRFDPISANGARYVSENRRIVKNFTAAAAMIKKAGAISSPIRPTNHAATSGVNPPMTPKQIL